MAGLFIALQKCLHGSQGPASACSACALRPVTQRRAAACSAPAVMKAGCEHFASFALWTCVMLHTIKFTIKHAIQQRTSLFLWLHSKQKLSWDMRTCYIMTKRLSCAFNSSDTSLRETTQALLLPMGDMSTGTQCPLAARRDLSMLIHATATLHTHAKTAINCTSK